MGEIPGRYPAVHLERAHGRDNDGDTRLQPAPAALDVEELFRAQVGTESGFGDYVVAQPQRRIRGDQRVAAMGNVGKWPAMNEGGRVFQGLDQVGHEGILEQHRHGSMSLEIARRNRLTITRVSDHDIAQPVLKIGQVVRQAENGHDLGGDGDIETAFTWITVANPAQPGGNMAQVAIVHVDDPLPGDAAHIDIEGIAPVDMIVQHRGQQIVGRADGMKVTGKMKVDFLHRHDLRIAPAGGAALHAEAGPQAGFTHADHGFLADARQAVTKPYRGCGLAFAGRRRGDGGDQDQLAPRAIGQPAQELIVDLGNMVSVRPERLFRDGQFGCNVSNRLLVGMARDCDITADLDNRLRGFVGRDTGFGFNGRDTCNFLDHVCFLGNGGLHALYSNWHRQQPGYGHSATSCFLFATFSPLRQT